MRKKYYTDSIGIEFEIDDETKTLKLIEVKEIDVDVFPPLAVDDKIKMSWLVDALAGKIMATLSDARLLEKSQGAAIKQGEQTRTAKCPHCGHPITAKKPCCGGKASHEICPGCGKPVMVEW